MTLVCSECGREIPEGMDFCPFCGRYSDTALRFDDQGRYIDDRCHSCGAELEPDARFCIVCGAPVTQAILNFPGRPQMRKNGQLALIVGLIFGFFNIFGIGHLIMRNWSRAFMFLGITAILMYIDPSLFYSSNLMITLLRVGVYMYQCMDLLALVYRPEVK